MTFELLAGSGIKLAAPHAFPSTGISSAGLPSSTLSGEKGLRVANGTRLQVGDFGDYIAAMTMALGNRWGRESRSKLRVKVRSDGNRGLFVFDRLADVKSTAIFIHTRRNRAEEQWLYIAAPKRVKRISSSNPSGPFVRSEFSYAGIGTQVVRKLTYAHFPDEACGNATCAVAERGPVEKRSSRIDRVVWHRTENFRPRTVECDQRNSTLPKTLELTKYKQYPGKFRRAEELSMESRLAGRNALQTWSDHAFRAGLGETNFSRAGLKRVR